MLTSLRLEALRIVEHFAVTVAEDVGAEPAVHPEQAGLEARRQDRLHEGLAGLEVLAADRHVASRARARACRDVDSQVGRAVGERDALHHRGVGVDLARRDVVAVVLQALLEAAERLVDLGRLAIGLGARRTRR